MNNYLTFCARAKFNRLIENSPGCIAMTLTTRPAGGFDIGYLFARDSRYDIIISNSPYVMTDLYTLGRLKQDSIDFDYNTQEFVITKDTHELSVNA